MYDTFTNEYTKVNKIPSESVSTEKRKSVSSLYSNYEDSNERIIMSAPNLINLSF